MNDQNFKNIASNKIQVSLNCKNPRIFFIKSDNFLFVFVLQCIQRKNIQLKYKKGAKRPDNLVLYIYLYYARNRTVARGVKRTRAPLSHTCSNLIFTFSF